MDRASSLGTFPQLLSPRHEQRFTPFAFFSSKSLVAASSQVTYKKMADAPTLDDHVVPPIAFNATNRNSSNAHEQHPPPYPNQDHALAPYDAIVPRQSDDELALIRVLAFVGRKDLEIHELRSRVASLEEELEIMEVEQLCSILEDSDTQSVEEDESSDAETIKACRVPSSPAASSPSTVPPSVASQKYAPRGRTARARQAIERRVNRAQSLYESEYAADSEGESGSEPSPWVPRKAQRAAHLTGPRRKASGRGPALVDWIQTVSDEAGPPSHSRQTADPTPASTAVAVGKTSGDRVKQGE